MIVTLKLIPSKPDGKFFAPPCTFAPQVTVDLEEMCKFNTLRRTGTAIVSDSEIAILLSSIPRVFSEMFGVDVIEIGLPTGGEIQIYDTKAADDDRR